MKNFTHLLVLLLVTGFFLVSCSKDNGDDDPQNANNPAEGGMLKCTVDGNNWEATLAVVATNDPGLVTITGSDSNSQQLMFSINNVNGTGTYNLGGSLTNQNMGRWTKGIGQNDTYTTMLGQGSGTVTIDELTDTGFSGIFEFTAKNGMQEEIVIGNGKFDATFSE